MLHLLWVILIGIVIGAIGSLIVGRDLPGGWIGNLIGGLAGAWLGESLLGAWGPQVAGMAVVPAVIGAMVVVFIVSLIIGTSRKRAA